MHYIRIKYCGSPKGLVQTDWGSWIDTYTARDIEMKMGKRKYIPLGFACELPQGYEAILAPRSSTFKNWGLLQTNSIGVIDSTFCGDNDE